MSTEALRKTIRSKTYEDAVQDLIVALVVIECGPKPTEDDLQRVYKQVFGPDGVINVRALVSPLLRAAEAFSE